MKRRTRPPIAQDSIYRSVQSEIIEGSLGPGERLPSRLAIERNFGVSSVTVQRAFDRLIQDGFVEVRGPHGTFVSKTPSHLFRYAVAFPGPFEIPPRSQWFSALLQSSQMIELTLDRKITQYSEVDDHVMSAGLHNLVRDVSSRCLAGVILVGKHRLADQTLESICSSMPCVALGTHEQIGSLSRLIRVELGGAVGFLRRALEHLAKKKRHRVAMLTVSGAAVSRIDEFRCCARALGLETDPMWIHGVDPWHARWTANVLRLLFRRENPMIPDALIIDDDNLVDHACCGLVAAGVRVPADVEVVSHWNYPIEPPGRIPFIRLGYDSGAALLNCIGLIDKQNRGEETRDSIMLDAVFEWELEETQKRAAAQFANR